LQIRLKQGRLHPLVAPPRESTIYFNIAAKHLRIENTGKLEHLKKLKFLEAPFQKRRIFPKRTFHFTG
jgi:hypothetical protein